MPGSVTAVRTMAQTPKVNHVISELHRQCSSLGAQDDLTWDLKNDLEGLPIETRRSVVKSVFGGCAPLFKATRVGNLKVVRYLIQNCGADVNQKGLSVDGDQVYHSTTPLWCAAVKGYKPLVEFLLKSGADINAVTDTGSTAVRSACYSSQFDIVELLISYGADIARPNQNGGTCLINSVQSPELCALLLKNGANVNGQDIQGKTALHYAVEESFIDTIGVLVVAGADLTIKSNDGDTPLRLACALGKEEIAFKLMGFSSTSLTLAEKADCLALLGSSVFDVKSDLNTAVDLWKTSLQTRPELVELPAELFLTDNAFFAGKKEFRTAEELSSICDDMDSVRTQSLLITQRILGWEHPETFQRFLLRGGSYMESGRLREAMWVWIELFAREIDVFGMLGEQTLFLIAASILPLFVAMSNDHTLFNDAVSGSIQVLDFLIAGIKTCRPSLYIRPQSKNQQEIFDDVIGCIPYLLHYAIYCSSEDNPALISACSRLGEINSRTFEHEASVLHLATASGLSIKTKSLSDVTPTLPSILPSSNVVRLLLKAKWNPNVTDKNGATPLHNIFFAFRSPNGNESTESVAKLLIDAGCHVDRVDNWGRSAYDRLFSKPVLSLKCLAAQAFNRVRCVDDIDRRLRQLQPGIDDVPPVPWEVREFIDAHSSCSNRRHSSGDEGTSLNGSEKGKLFIK